MKILKLLKDDRDFYQLYDEIVIYCTKMLGKLFTYLEMIPLINPKEIANALGWDPQNLADHWKEFRIKFEDDLKSEFKPRVIPIFWDNVQLECANIPYVLQIRDAFWADPKGCTYDHGIAHLIINNHKADITHIDEPPIVFCTDAQLIMTYSKQVIVDYLIKDEHAISCSDSNWVWATELFDIINEKAVNSENRNRILYHINLNCIKELINSNCEILTNKIPEWLLKVRNISRLTFKPNYGKSYIEVFYPNGLPVKDNKGNPGCIDYIVKYPGRNPNLIIDHAALTYLAIKDILMEDPKFLNQSTYYQLPH